MGLVQAGIRELMLKAEDNSQEVENVSLDVPSKSCSLTLHYLLVMICRKEAGVIVHNAGDSEGAVAWRNLIARYEPKTLTRLATLLLALIRFQFTGPIQERLEIFEREVVRYEQRLVETISLKMRTEFD